MVFSSAAQSDEFDNNQAFVSGFSGRFSHEQIRETESYPGELAMLRQQSEQLNKVIDVMPTGLVLLDGNGIVTKINDMARRLLDEPILGQPWFDVIKRSFEPREDDWHEVSLKDGRRVKLEISTLGNQPGQLIMITDLTETRLMQDKISHMKRLSSLGHMVSTLAHQIRTPLSAAMLYGANLSNKQLQATDREDFQDKLMSRLHDLEQQVNDMLLFAKSGKQQVVDGLSINTLIDDAVADMDALLNKSNAQVIITHQDEHLNILGNKNALTGAIQNLIHNSLQVIKEGAEIRISTMINDDMAHIHVIDNGKGIDESIVNKIFEPFYTSRAQGTGLGLAVVKSVVNAHQGDVQVIKGTNKGAHFLIQLPLQFENQNEDPSMQPSSGGVL